MNRDMIVKYMTAGTGKDLSEATADIKAVKNYPFG